MANINIELLKLNPIERYRQQLGYSQKEFSRKLGYGSATTYRYHCNRFTPDIRQRLKDVLNVDLTNEAIEHLLHKSGTSPRQPGKPKKPTTKETLLEDMIG